MDSIQVKREGNVLRIGESPQLVIHLDTQENYIQTDLKQIPYHKKVVFSEDLLNGKRKEVMETAIQYYYEHACEVVRDSQIAEAYRARANLTEIEKWKE